MTKIAFMFPGQGSFEAGMGREIAEAVPEAMAVYDEGSDAAGHGHQASSASSRRVEDLVDTEVQQPALVATWLAIDAALRARGIAPDVVVGHSVGEFAALGSASALSVARRDRARARARPRDGRGGAGRIRARWRRSSVSPTRPSRRSAARSRTCGRRTTTAPASSSSPARRRRSTRHAPRRRAKARGARSGSASRARSTRRSSRARPNALRPAIERVHLAEGTARVHVDGDRAGRGRAPLSASCSSSS